MIICLVIGNFNFIDRFDLRIEVKLIISRFF